MAISLIFSKTITSTNNQVEINLLLRIAILDVGVASFENTKLSCALFYNLLRNTVNKFGYFYKCCLLLFRE